MEDDTLDLVNEGLKNLSIIADAAWDFRDGDVELVIEDIKEAVLASVRSSGGSIGDIAGYCAFLVLRMRGRL